MARGSGGFRLNARKVGLTYSCPVNADENPIQSREQILEILKEKFGLCLYVICTELHENGKKHYHAWLNFDKKVDTRDVRAFDIESVHPNIIQKPGAGWINYVKKAGQFISNVAENPFTLALAMNSVNEAIDSLWKAVPQTMALSADRIERNLRTKMAPPPVAFTFYDGPYRWPYLSEIQSVCLTGNAGIFKTNFALSKHHFENPFFCTHLDELKRFNSTYDGIIFDDLDFSHLPITTQISLTDFDQGRHIHIRYGTAYIPPKTRKIFVRNYNPFSDDPAVNRRVTHITLE